MFRNNRMEHLWRSRSFVFHEKQKQYLYSMLAVISWATAPVFFKIGVQSLSFGAAVFWFLLFGGLFLIILGVKDIEELKRVDWKKFIIFSVIAGATQTAHYLSYINAILSQQDVSLTLTIVKTSTLLQVLFSILILKRKEASNKRIIAAMLICFLGATIVATELKFQSFVPSPSILLALLAAVAWAFCVTILQKSKQTMVIITAASLLWGALFTWFFGYLTGQPLELPKGISEWLWLLYLGAVPTGLALAKWATALDKMKEKDYKIIILDYFAPIIGVLACIILLKETPSLIFFLGFVLVVGGNLASSDKWNFILEKLKMSLKNSNR